MIYNCALICFLCASSSLLTVSLFSERWLLIEISVKSNYRLQVTTFITVGLWETRRLRYYHFRHHHTVYVFHDYMQSDSSSEAVAQLRRNAAKPTPPPTTPPVAKGNTTTTTTAASVAKQLVLNSSPMSEQALLQLAVTYFAALVVTRVLLFLALGLAFTCLLLLLLYACNDATIIRHRYKERRLAYSLAALCSASFLLSVVSWSIFLGTVYAAVLRAGETPSVLNSGFVCCVLSSISLLVSAVLSIFTSIE